MKSKYRNIFLMFGIAAIVVMLCSFDMEYDELLANLRGRECGCGCGRVMDYYFICSIPFLGILSSGMEKREHLFHFGKFIN